VLLAGALWVSYWPHTGEPAIHISKRLLRGLVGAVLAVLLLVSGVLIVRHQRVQHAAALARQQEAITTSTAPLPKLLDLGSATCEACQEMAPALEELKTELQGKVNVQYVDIGKNPAYVEKYELVATPTQIFFDASGKQIGRHEGALTKTEALAELRRLGIKVD